MVRIDKMREPSTRITVALVIAWAGDDDVLRYVLRTVDGRTPCLPNSDMPGCMPVESIGISLFNDAVAYPRYTHRELTAMLQLEAAHARDMLGVRTITLGMSIAIPRAGKLTLRPGYTLSSNWIGDLGPRHTYVRNAVRNKLRERIEAWSKRSNG